MFAALARFLFFTLEPFLLPYMLSPENTGISLLSHHNIAECRESLTNTAFFHSVVTSFSVVLAKVRNCFSCCNLTLPSFAFCMSQYARTLAAIEAAISGPLVSRWPRQRARTASSMWSHGSVPGIRGTVGLAWRARLASSEDRSI